VGAAEVGLLAALVGAWGAISVFVGPIFGWHPTSTSAWDWTMQNWLLHLIPGAVAIGAGLIILMTSAARNASTRAPLGLSALLLVAAGSWFVLGPVVWPIFYSGPAFTPGTDATTNFVNQLGSSLGPGLLLAILGGMALKAGLARPAVAVDEGGPPSGESPTAAEPVVEQAPAAGATGREGETPMGSEPVGEDQVGRGL
jgi:hypothetical protein